MITAWILAIIFGSVSLVMFLIAFRVERPSYESPILAVIIRLVAIVFGIVSAICGIAGGVCAIIRYMY
jgi:uncharacterized membrane protein YfcA